jgi:hypothetical protein
MKVKTATPSKSGSVPKSLRKTNRQISESRVMVVAFMSVVDSCP